MFIAQAFTSKLTSFLHSTLTLLNLLACGHVRACQPRKSIVALRVLRTVTVRPQSAAALRKHLDAPAAFLHQIPDSAK